MTHQPYQVMPPLAAEEYEALKADISARGVQVPVEYDEFDNILDGHHRVQICRELGMTNWPKLVRYGLNEAEKRRHARRLNLDRRHLNAEQRRDLIAEDLRENPAASNRAVASALNVHHGTVGAVRSDLESTGQISQLKERQGRDGKTRRITQFIPSNEAETKGLQRTAKDINAREREERRQNVRALHAELSEKSAPLPQGRKYPVIYADPASEFKAGFGDRSIENHYPTMPISEWCKLPVGDLALNDCLLLCWTTVPQLAATINELLPAWGFEYKSCLAWDKEVIGTGYWVRNQHELLLIATRGAPPLPEPSCVPASVYREKRGPHSAKPFHYYDLIERMTPGLPRIELFARTRRDGWDAWGNQAHISNSSSGDGLGIHEPGSMTWGDRNAMTAPSGRADDSAKCPAITGSHAANLNDDLAIPDFLRRPA